jgi:prepilin-type N-terminal cleavage/methylation domain-containing protein
MHSLPRGRCAARRGDEGYSLTELIVSMGIFGIIIALTFGLLIQITNESKYTLARVRTLEQAKFGISQIDRQVRSGNVILDPYLEDESTSGVPKYFSMRIYTQADGIAKCAQWRVKDLNGDTYGDLQFRTWEPGYPSVDVVEPWASVAHDLVQMDVAPTKPADILVNQPTTWPPFWVDNTATGGTQAQLVRVTLRLKDPQERTGTKATSVTTVITGRNTVFGYPASSCGIAPPP